jgi:hypothetical protein
MNVVRMLRWRAAVDPGFEAGFAGVHDLDALRAAGHPRRGHTRSLCALL